MAKKVTGKGTSTSTKTPTEKAPKAKKTRAEFPIKTAKTIDAEGNIVNAVDDKGKLTAVPITIPGESPDDKPKFAGFDSSKHKPLKKTDFASEDVFLDFRALINREKADKLIEQADSFTEKANKIRKFGDTKTRKKATKLEKMRKQMAELEKELVSEGFDLEDLGEE